MDWSSSQSREPRDGQSNANEKKSPGHYGTATR